MIGKEGGRHEGYRRDRGRQGGKSEGGKEKEGRSMHILK